MRLSMTAGYLRVVLLSWNRFMMDLDWFMDCLFVLIGIQISVPGLLNRELKVGEPTEFSQDALDLHHAFA